ncbi:MAG: TetR/AcrR family transcriptional regulator [Sutterella sp.]|nr:TetR/AcrR family transcriptional regulator [Sutterella sp.]
MEQHREEIVDAAERCVRERGLHQLKLRDIARESGKSLGTLYNYFQNKEAIVEALVERQTERFIAVATSITEPVPGESQEERITREVSSLVDAYMDAEAMRVSISIASEALVNPRVFEIHNAANRRICDYVINLFRSNSKCGPSGGTDEEVEASFVIVRAFLEGMRGAIVFNPGLDREIIRSFMIERLTVLWHWDIAKVSGKTIQDVFGPLD